ncbi:MAG TPA: aldehyde dehydrogenase [Chitinophagales bacterium]|nr:aldehyde dehydrogenase [Chitinophagales bacterium]
MAIFAASKIFIAKKTSMLQIQNYIGGRLINPVAGKFLPNENPALGNVYSEVPDSDEQDVELAVNAAQKAFPSWSATSSSERCRIMMRIADLIEEKLEHLAGLESTDQGKPVSLSRTLDIPRAASNFRFFATAAVQFASEAHVMESGTVNYTLRQPLGVVGCISPWNLPLYLFTWKIVPALAAGNCVIAKPSEVTPMTAYELSKICMEAGMPDGVLNILHGLGPKCGAAIVKHPRVKAISFTGSTRAGKEIAAVAAPMFKKLSLELGGKNPNIIFADCDFEKMIKTTINSSFENQGEICLCGSRIIIEKSIYEKFKERFIAETKKLKVGDPLEEDTNIGAIVSKQHFDKINYHINLAKEEGGKILSGGNVVKMKGRCENGWFIEPTIIEGLPANCRTNQEEIFGPVVTLIPFNTEDEAIQLANSTEYGLSATIWTQNLSSAHRVASRVQSGIIWINCWLLRDLRTPFGGMKNSGVGREGGFEAMKFFTEAKNVCVKL